MKRFASLPLGTKLTTAILGTTMLALLLGMSLTMISLFQGYRASTLDRTRTLAELMAASSQAPLDFQDPDTATENFAALGLVSGEAWARLYDAAGNLFAQYGQELEQGLAPSGPAREHVGLHALSVRLPVRSGGEVVGWLVVGQSLGGQWRLLLWQGGVSLAIMLLALGMCLPAARRFRHSITASLVRLGKAMETIARDKDFSHRVGHSANDEIGLLARQFNHMITEVEKRDQWLASHRELLEEMVEQRTRELLAKQLELAEKNRQLSREIKERREAEMIREEVERINRHDLKSSLSLVTGYPELLLRQGGLNEQQQVYLRRIETAGFRMLDLVKTQLDLFKMEQGIYRLKQTAIDLVEELCALEEELLPLADKQGVHIRMTLNGRSIEGLERVPLAGEPPLIATMLRNLLINAIEASCEGDAVDVDIMQGTRVRLSIKNSMPVPESVRSRFFDKYVTYGKGEGTGLGTYSASLIARIHGANITMRTGEALGTVVRIAFSSPAPHKQSKPPALCAES